jgi:hypothetical protein
MNNSKFWVVRNPTYLSEFEDICWETDTNGLATYIVGTGVDKFKSENHAIYHSEMIAKNDAHLRMKVRNDLLSVLQRV